MAILFFVDLFVVDVVDLLGVALVECCALGLERLGEEAVGC